MKTLQLRVPLTPEFKNEYVSIDRTEIDINIELENGAHTITTPLFNVGNRNNHILQAKLTFWYRYEELNNVITLCGNDYISQDSMCVITVLKDTEQSCYQHTFPEDEHGCGTNPDWNYCHPEISQLKEMLLQTVREANTILIEEAKKHFTVIECTPIPDLPDHVVNTLQAVYRNGKFLELYNPVTAYTTNDTVFNIKSVFGGKIYLKSTDNFANVIGSTHDPKIDNQAWVRLWESNFGPYNNCASNGMPGFTCKGTIVGGHVILGTTASAVPKGSNSVFIIPICHSHNMDNSVYMSPLIYNQGVALKNYMGT